MSGAAGDDRAGRTGARCRGPEPGILPADWPAPPGVRAFTTLRAGPGLSAPPFDRFNLGARCGDDPAAVARNRAALVDGLRLPAAPRWLQQVHGVDVLRFDDPGQGVSATEPVAAEPVADAAVTAVPGVVLAVLTADCLPVVFAAGDGDEVAVAHAGWRGLAAGVLERTVAAMQGARGALSVWLGPAAGPGRYEVGEEVRDAFLAHAASAAAAFTATRPGHWRVDLYALARQRLADAGVPAARVHGGGLCTISEPARFFSHRRDRSTGRMATVVWRERR